MSGNDGLEPVLGADVDELEALDEEFEEATHEEKRAAKRPGVYIIMGDWIAEGGRRLGIGWSTEADGGQAKRDLEASERYANITVEEYDPAKHDS